MQDGVITRASNFIRRPLWWACGLVIVSGLIFGFYILQTYFSPRHRQYQLDFGGAKWIEPQQFGPVAYFRKEVFLSAEPTQAWLQISATDNFNASINGRVIGSQDSVKTRVAGIYDIKKRLKPGTNVIAVSIARTSFPGSAQLLVRGLIRQPGEDELEVISDEHWRVATETGIVGGAIDWTSPLVQEELWPAAKPVTFRKSPAINWVDMNPRVLQHMPTGWWILSQNATSEAVFSTTVQAEGTGQETWLQLASSGELDLLVNGHLVTAAVPDAAGGKQLPHLAKTPQAAAPTAHELTSRVAARRAMAATRAVVRDETTTLEAYDISYWIKHGANSIVATVRADHRPATLFASGFFVRRDGSLRLFETSSDWQAMERWAGRPAETHPAIAIARNGSAPYGYLAQELARPIDHFGYAVAAGHVVVVGWTVIGLLAIWFVVSVIVSQFKRETLQRGLVRDALLHVPVALGLVLLLLLNFDPRFPDEWSFRPRIIIIGALAFLAVRGLHFITGLRPKWNLFKDRQEFIPRPAIPYLVLAIVMGLGLALRLHGLGYISFDHDEMGLITKSHGIYHLGFPYTMFAGEVRPLTTYEAVPYPLALSGLIFGYSEWSMRLPACLFGTLTIGVIALFGRRLFNWRTGLATAFIYACIPLNIRWAQNSFYPQQCQFFAMFTCWMFYEAIRVKPLHRRFLTVASISFCVTYLSWEGTAFLLPALFLGLMVIRWGKWWWLKEFHLYRCLFFIGAVVVAEYCSRTLAGFPYLQIGSGLSNLTGPSLFFLTAAYQPMFYIDKLWLSENHVFFTVMALVGLPFCWRERGFRYVFVLLVTLWFLHTNFLAALSPRYCYYYQPLLVLSGTAAAVGLYDRFLALLKEESVMGRAAAHLSGGLALLLLFLQSNESVLREYHLSSLGDAPGLMTRMYTYRYDYRGAAKFVKERAQPGDVIFPGIPHVFAYYAGIPGDYFLNTLLASKVPYNQTLSEPRFVDKFAGLPVVRNLAELREVVNRGRRTWIIFAPYASFERLTNPNVLEYLDQNAKVVYESYRVKVLLVEGRKGSASLVQSP